MNSLRRNGLAFALASVLAGVVVATLLHGPVRTGAWVGLLVGALSGAIGLGFVATAAEKSLQAALVALVSGFLIRLVMVGAALFACRFVSGDALACAGGFFALYVVGQGLEIALVSARARTGAAGQEHRA